jgi:hypothetical protein
MHTHDITTSKAIVACLLLMVLVEVGSRQLIVALRYLNLRNQTTPAALNRPDDTALSPGSR